MVSFVVAGGHCLAASRRRAVQHTSDGSTWRLLKRPHRKADPKSRKSHRETAARRDWPQRCIVLRLLLIAARLAGGMAVYIC